MAALVQTFPQQTSPVAMLPTRPASSSAAFGPSSSSPHAGSRSPQLTRYNTPPTPTNYRGLPSTSVHSYTFNGPPSLNKPPPPHLRPENRTTSAPVVSHGHHHSVHGDMVYRQQHAPAPSLTNAYSFSDFQSSGPHTHDDSSISQRPFRPESISRPKSAVNLSTPSPALAAHPTSSSGSAPDRYQRPQRRHEGSEQQQQQQQQQPAGGNLYTVPGRSSSSPSLHTYQSYRGQVYSQGNQARMGSADDMSVPRAPLEPAQRYRRRSVGSPDVTDQSSSKSISRASTPPQNVPVQQPQSTVQPETKQQEELPPRLSSHKHTGSMDSVSSTRSSSRPSSRRDSSPASPSRGSVQQVIPVQKQEVKVVNLSARTPEFAKRSTAPSPLSKPLPMSSASPTASERPTTPSAPKEEESSTAVDALPDPNDSPAARHLAAVGKKDDSRKKSKLRRAFSFGSASELRKATAQANHEKTNATSRAAKRTSKYEDELEPEQAAIAQRQEEAGLGESIYSMGQGNYFTGSTDNVSISSTASSASIMLRKMGKGVKKGTKSLVGLFRPKSVIGVPAADGPVVQAPVAEVSMVTVEAEREKVNVNVDPKDQAGGGTGFPKLQRNSIDAAANTSISSTSTDIRSRRSIVGGEKERAEVLAAVKKGILKRTDSGQQSPAAPQGYKAPDFNLPQIPHVNDSPHSSAPSTPGDDQPPRSGHRRTDSIAIEGLEHEDYFSSITRFASLEAKGGAAPLTPHTPSNRNISFSPRIQFHDTWPSTDYDRRGEIATCNRLTPMLAQQIKEELNTFKMEMEVHETSKVYTHFF